MANESMAQGSMFEALFTRALRPIGPFADELRRVGFDPDHPQPQYPTPVWVACLAVTRRLVFGELDDAAAYRAIGERFMGSFLDTIAGKIVAVALPFLGPQAFLKRIPRYLTMGRSDLRWEVKLEEPRRLVAHLHDPFSVPAHFLAGIIDKAMKLIRAPAVITVVPQSPTESELDIRW
ncbi:MAG: DUF2378 family protein [Deltaproteobacteria bacterium]|nr:DUF2378 family protein [Deltaproteobacteria bacterium]